MKRYKLKELCLEITNKCPLRCIHCSSNAFFHSEEELSFKLIKKIIDDFKKLGGEILEISGGEPLFHRDLYNITRHAKKNKLKVYLYTTGLRSRNKPLNKEDIRELLKTGADRFLFGLHGSRADIHERITTKKGSFLKTIETIKKLKQRGVYVGIHFVPTKINYNELKVVAKVAAETGVNEFAILRFVSQGRGYKNRSLLELDRKEVEQLLSVIKKLEKQYNFVRLGCPINFSFLFENSKISKCKIGEKTLAIRADGTVTLCPAFKYEELVGNVKENNLKWIWENSPVLNRIRQTKKEMGACINCSYFKLCGGRCLAQHYYNYGEISKGKDPWCEIAKKIHQHGEPDKR